jgi:hypothetical protein
MKSTDRVKHRVALFATRCFFCFSARKEERMTNLFTSRKIWIALLMLIAVLIASFNPAFDLRTEDAAGFAVVAVAYLVGVAVDPGPGGWRGVLQSRKFWAAVLGFLIVFLDAFHIALPFNLTPEILVTIAVTIGGYIAGVALEKPKTISLSSTTAQLNLPIKPSSLPGYGDELRR